MGELIDRNLRVLVLGTTDTFTVSLGIRLHGSCCHGEGMGNHLKINEQIQSPLRKSNIRLRVFNVKSQESIRQNFGIQILTFQDAMQLCIPTGVDEAWQQNIRSTSWHWHRECRKCGVNLACRCFQGSKAPMILWSMRVPNRQTFWNNSRTIAGALYHLRHNPSWNSQFMAPQGKGYAFVVLNLDAYAACMWHFVNGFRCTGRRISRKWTCPDPTIRFGRWLLLALNLAIQISDAPQTHIHRCITLFMTDTTCHAIWLILDIVVGLMERPALWSFEADMLQQISNGSCTSIYIADTSMWRHTHLRISDTLWLMDIWGVERQATSYNTDLLQARAHELWAVLVVTCHTCHSQNGCRWMLNARQFVDWIIESSDEIRTTVIHIRISPTKNVLILLVDVWAINLHWSPSIRDFWIKATKSWWSQMTTAILGFQDSKWLCLDESWQSW